MDVAELGIRGDSQAVGSTATGQAFPLKNLKSKKTLGLGTATPMTFATASLSESVVSAFDADDVFVSIIVLRLQVHT